MKKPQNRKDYFLLIGKRFLALGFINLILMFLTCLVNLLINNSKPLAVWFKIWMLSTLIILIFGGAIYLLSNWKSNKKNLWNRTK